MLFSLSILEVHLANVIHVMYMIYMWVFSSTSIMYWWIYPSEISLEYCVFDKSIKKVQTIFILQVAHQVFHVFIQLSLCINQVYVLADNVSYTTCGPGWLVS